LEEQRAAGIGAWLGLEPRDTPLRWSLPLARHLCAPGGVLFGGALLAAAVAAAEAATAPRRAALAHAALLRAPRLGELVDLEVEVRAAGRRIAQAAVRARCGHDEVAVAQLALVESTASGSIQHWGAAPEVPAPEACSERDYRDPDPESINGALDVRLARGRRREALHGPSADGRCVLWARVRRPVTPSTGVLALLADHIPFGARQALGRDAGVLSLDQSLRVVSLDFTDWVLLDIQIAAVCGDLGQGRAALFSPDGALLATAAQSFRLLD
jgi:acyl-CoA thioesterase